MTRLTRELLTIVQMDGSLRHFDIRNDGTYYEYVPEGDIFRLIGELKDPEAKKGTYGYLKWRSVIE